MNTTSGNSTVNYLNTSLNVATTATSTGSTTGASSSSNSASTAGAANSKHHTNNASFHHHHSHHHSHGGGGGYHHNSHHHHHCTLASYHHLEQHDSQLSSFSNPAASATLPATPSTSSKKTFGVDLRQVEMTQVVCNEYYLIVPR
jgi:hypothetical protein